MQLLDVVSPARWLSIGLLGTLLLGASPVVAQRSGSGTAGATKGKAKPKPKPKAKAKKGATLKPEAEATKGKPGKRTFGARGNLGKKLGSATSSASTDGPGGGGGDGLGSQSSDDVVATPPAKKPALGSKAAGKPSNPVLKVLSVAAPTGYKAKVTTKNPTAVLILADLSGSMSQGSATPGKSRADVQADAINQIIEDLIVANLQGGDVRNRIELGVLSAADLDSEPLLPNATDDLHPLSFIADNMLPGTVVDDVNRPKWLPSTYRGANGDVQAFSRASRVLRSWVAGHPDAFPPTIINITDGYASDGDPTPIALDIRNSIKTSDGGALLFNVHIGEGGAPILFPSSPDELPNAEARTLYEMASPLPPNMIAAARAKGIKVKDGAKAFAYNADLPVLLDFLSVGSSVAL